MKPQQVTDAIVLTRIDYGEADRIITLLTSDHGKLRLMAKGVRRVKSKLAGGIELFSVTDITYIKGRGEIGTLVSARLRTHYGHIVQDLDRTMLGYDLIKQLHKATEDEPEPEYFSLLQEAFAALDDPVISLDLIRLWFGAQLLRLAGHTPNLQTDDQDNTLDAAKAYQFNFEQMAFAQNPEGQCGADHIKFLRIVFGGNQPKTLQKVQGSADLVRVCAPLVAAMQRTYIRL